MKINDDAKNQIDNIKKQAEKHIFKIIKMYADENNPYRINDIIEDHYQLGKIKSIRHSIYIGSPSYDTSYICERLKKDLTPYKNGEIITIYLSNVKQKHIK